MYSFIKFLQLKLFTIKNYLRFSFIHKKAVI